MAQLLIEMTDEGLTNVFSSKTDKGIMLEEGGEGGGGALSSHCGERER